MRAGSIPAPGSHGGDGPAVAAALGLDAADLLDLSQSLNPFAPDPRPVVARHLDQVGRYPDDGPATASLAAAMGVDPGRLLLTNGGAEAISLVAAELGRGWVDEPDFALYRRSLAEIDPTAPRFRSNPHNPSGLLAAPTEQAAVWDEAFFPLATGRWTRGDADTIVVGSLTKLLACPGLRVGYVLGPDPGTIGQLRARQPLWAVNGLACGAIPDLLAAVDLPIWSARLAAARSDLVGLLHRHGLMTHPSDAAWVLIDAPGLRAALAPHGVLVRDCAGFGLPGVVRMAVPDDAGRARRALALERSQLASAPDGALPSAPRRPRP
jgi:histidinol-phosphate/aromatic aminotransferase/cobyric acid decarboxylase-like protein